MRNRFPYQLNDYGAQDEPEENNRLSVDTQIDDRFLRLWLRAVERAVGASGDPYDQTSLRYRLKQLESLFADTRLCAEVFTVAGYTSGNLELVLLHQPKGDTGVVIYEGMTLVQGETRDFVIAADKVLRIFPDLIENGDTVSITYFY